MKERQDLLHSLKRRFEKHMARHEGIAWTGVQARLEANVGALESLHWMEDTGGEPDVIGQDKATGCYLYCDCAAESPSGRRSLCYDQEALDARKEHKPQGSALDRAAAMGIRLLSEEQYRVLQQYGEFDTRTSSWVCTLAELRRLGGAPFCDRRYGRIFVRVALTAVVIYSMLFLRRSACATPNSVSCTDPSLIASLAGSDECGRGSERRCRVDRQVCFACQS